MKLLILAAPRSGTRFIADALNRAGLHIGHEIIYEAGGVDYQRLLLDNSEFTEIWHQVRHPLKAIESIATMFSGVMLDDLLRPFEISPPTPLIGAALFWLAFQEEAEAQAQWRYRVEDVEKLWPEILKRTGLPTPPDGALDNTSRYYSGEPRELTWEQLGRLEAPVRRLAEKYGY